MRTAQGRALFGGVAAQTFRPLHYPMTSAIGLGILTAGHRHGWPVAAGGSASITTALAAMLTDLGGKIETGVPIQAASQLPPADATLFDLAPESVAAILADRLPPRIQRAYSRFRREPGALKGLRRRGWGSVDKPARPAAPGPCTWAAAHWDTGVLAMSDVLLRMVGRHSRA